MSEGNNIREWSYDAPTEPGLYLACFGDVETADNIYFAEFKDYSGLGLTDRDGDTPAEYSSSYKWARLRVGSEVEEE